MVALAEVVFLAQIKLHTLVLDLHGAVRQHNFALGINLRYVRA